MNSALPAGTASLTALMSETGSSVVSHVVQYRAGDDRDRAAEVKQLADRWHGEHRPRVGDVGLDHDGLVVLGEQRPAVRQHARVIVYVGDAGRRVGALRDLVHVVRRRQAGAEVDELADAQLARR